MKKNRRKYSAIPELKMKATLVLFFLIIIFFKMQAQPPDKFKTKFGGEGIDIGYSVRETYNRQYIIVGSTTSYGFGSADAYLVLLDSMGQIVWEKNFGGAMTDIGKSILVNPVDSGFVFAGYTSSFGNGGFDIYLVRTDKNGNFKWQSSFGGSDWDFGTDLTLASDGNLVVCGNSYSSGYGKNDGMVLKVNINSGGLIWQKYFGGAEDDDFKTIRSTTDGMYTIAGNTKSYGDPHGDFWFFKVNGFGDSISSKKLGYPNKGEVCYDFTEDANQNLAFCGSYDTSYNNVGKNVAYIIKADLDGNYVNEQKVIGATTNEDRFLSITNKSFGSEYFLSRKVRNGSAYLIDVQSYLMQYDYIYKGASTYGDTKNDEAFETILTSDGGFLMVGYTMGNSSVSEDVYVVKLDANLLVPPSVVGINESQDHQGGNTLFYYNNELYFDNHCAETLTFQVINSCGQVVQTGSTRGNLIKLNPDLINDIYLARILEKRNHSIKFIKN
jgi:hypothetical protein